MAGIYNFPEHISGDTFKGRVFHMEKRINNVLSDMDLTNTDIEMVIMNYQTGGIVYRFNLTNNLSITSALTGRWQFNKSVVSLSVGLYKYEIIFTFPTGEKYTYLKGTWSIIEN